MDALQYAAWKDSTKKWRTATMLKDPEKAFEWWLDTGGRPCAFCAIYVDRRVSIENRAHRCRLCPLWDTSQSETCAPEWDRIDDAAEKAIRIWLLETGRDNDRKVLSEFFAVFHREAQALFERIQALSHIKPEEHVS